MFDIGCLLNPQFNPRNVWNFYLPSRSSELLAKVDVLKDMLCCCRETILICVLDCLTLMRLPLLLSLVFVLSDLHVIFCLSVCLSVCYLFIFTLYLLYDFNNNNNNCKLIIRLIIWTHHHFLLHSVNLRLHAHHLAHSPHQSLCLHFHHLLLPHPRLKTRSKNPFLHFYSLSIPFWLSSLFTDGLARELLGIGVSVFLVSCFMYTSLFFIFVTYASVYADHTVNFLKSTLYCLCLGHRDYILRVSSTMGVLRHDVGAEYLGSR